MGDKSAKYGTDPEYRKAVHKKVGDTVVKAGVALSDASDRAKKAIMSSPSSAKSFIDRNLTPESIVNRFKSKPADPQLAEPSSYKRGGKVKKSGMAMVHKGECVLTKKQAENLERKKSARKRV